MIRFTRAVIFVLGLCQCHAMALAQSASLEAADEPTTITLFPLSYWQIDQIRKNFGQPTKKTFSLDLGAKVVEFQGFYLEKRQDGAAPTAALTDPSNARWGSYFDLLATSSVLNGKITGEGEIAYSTLGFAVLPDQQPIMSRVGISGNWGKTSYGAQYRSFGGGFVSLGGIKVDQPRDERQVWSEYDFGLFRLRGIFGESWEKIAESNALTVTRTASTFLNLTRPAWSASFSSSYAMSGQDPAASLQTRAFTNALSMVYRPTGFLTIEPALSFKQEWDNATLLKTDTPSAGLAIICSPDRNLQFLSRSSVARSLSEDPLKELSTINTTASLNWKMGKPFLGEQILSFQLEHKNELAPNTGTKPQAHLSSMIQWRIIGF